MTDEMVSGFGGLSNGVLVTELIVCTYWGFDEYDFGCYNSYNSSQIWYTDLSVDSIGSRQWQWMLCNEPLGFWQTYVAVPISFLVGVLAFSDTVKWCAKIERDDHITFCKCRVLATTV